MGQREVREQGTNTLIVVSVWRTGGGTQGVLGLANWNNVSGFCNTGLSFIVWDWAPEALGWIRGGLEYEGPIREVIRGVDLIGCSRRGIDWLFARALVKAACRQENKWYYSQRVRLPETLPSQRDISGLVIVNRMENGVLALKCFIKRDPWYCLWC